MNRVQKGGDGEKKKATYVGNVSNINSIYERGLFKRDHFPKLDHKMHTPEHESKQIYDILLLPLLVYALKTFSTQLENFIQERLLKIIKYCLLTKTRQPIKGSCLNDYQIVALTVVSIQLEHENGINKKL